MAIRERLVYAIDVVTDGAQKGLRNFRTAVSEAEGATGKFKAGASSAMSTVQAHAGSLALAGGTALVAFGAKSVEAFTDGALAAGKFSDATGIAVEDASRWVEVANDMGVSTEAIQGGFVKLEKAIGSNSPTVKNLGIEVQRTANGTADMNATMLDAIEKLGQIEDPAKRAKAATDLFGRGFADMAEIVLADADSIRGRLEEVSDAQIFDSDEVKKARELRDSLDELRDKFTQLTLKIGGELAPAISDTADSLSDLVDTADALKVPELLKFGAENTALNRVRQFFGLFSDGKKTLEAYEISQARGIDGAKRLAFQQESVNRTVAEGNPAFSQYTDNLKANAEATDKKAAADKKAADAAERHEEAVLAVAEAMEKQRSAALELVGGDIAVREAQRQAAEAAADLELSLDEQTRAQIDAAQAAADYRATQMEANGQTVNGAVQVQLMKEELANLVGQLDGPLAAALQAYINQLDALDGRTVRTAIVLDRPGRVGDFSGPVFGGKFDSGGVVPGPTGAPRMILAHGGETVLPTHKAAAGAAGGVVINATIYANDSESVFDKLAREVRQKGPGPILRALGLS